MRLRPSAPVLARTESSAQVGVHQPVVLTTLSPAQLHFLGSLEGGRHVSAREERMHAVILERLAHGGQLAPDPEPTARVRFHSAGAIAVEAATVLTRLGWRVAFADPAPAREGEHPARAAAGSSAGAHAAQRVRRAVPGAQVQGSDAAADLDVLVTVGLPVTVQRTLLSTDAPHLLVACDERGATVGPVVVPGSGACAQCLGMHATERDGLWPRLALQCETRRPRTDALTAGLAGMLVARLATRFLTGAPAAMWRVDDDSLRALPVPPPHEACRCTAA